MYAEDIMCNRTEQNHLYVAKVLNRWPVSATSAVKQIDDCCLVKINTAAIKIYEKEQLHNRVGILPSKLISVKHDILHTTHFDTIRFQAQWYGLFADNCLLLPPSCAWVSAQCTPTRQTPRRPVSTWQRSLRFGPCISFQGSLESINLTKSQPTSLKFEPLALRQLYRLLIQTFSSVDLLY